ncbi:MAG: transglutaminase-like domain-containing protein [Defluviitaleaceae bacterium]|nr:transglutaminase-like domain-containing protein [Defluviitaleaceae bacterium]MCL2274143.1 transglutaminase-like domain-containing protein [Defluviitaleaceae bacterium]
MKRKVYLLCAVPLAVVLFVVAVMLALPPRFVYELHSIITVAGFPVDAERFLVETEEMADVTVYFYEEVDFNAAGRRDVLLTLKRGRHTTQAIATLYIIEPREYVTVELGGYVPNEMFAPNIDPISFVANAHEMPRDLLDAQELEVLLTLPHFDNPIGMRMVFVSADNWSFTSAINIVDTTPPTAVLREVTMQMGREILAEYIVESVFDYSEVVSITVIQPDLFTPGEHTVQVILLDEHGNEATYTTTATLLPNEIPPVFFGITDIQTPQGEPIRFRAGVTAYDAFGRSLSFAVDSSQVNMHELGIYPATFTAVDAWGLETSATIYVHVLSVDPEAVVTMVDALLAQILREDMTQVQQARTIHNWLGDHISFAAAVGMDSVYEAAHQGLIHRRGNCFVFFALADLMLTGAGIPNRRVERIADTPNPTRHRWNLINPDELGWFHFDATSNRVITREERFMFTQSDAERFMQRFFYPYVDFYTFDTALHPEVTP